MARAHGLVAHAHAGVADRPQRAIVGEVVAQRAGRVGQRAVGRDARERIVAMMYANGATQAEIARSLGVTRSAVSAMMSRLREKTIAVFGEPAS